MTDGATQPAVATAAEAAPAANENVFLCPLPGSESELSIDRTAIPAPVRLALLDSAIKENVRNRVNAANVRFNKANEAWKAYDNAIAADAGQTAVAKPEGERPTIDLVAIAQKAREDLYAGNLRSTREPGKGRKSADPFVTAVTTAVARDWYERGKAEGKKGPEGKAWTFITAKAEVGNGVEFLAKRIDELVAAGGDRAALEKVMNEKYIKPARIMLGLDENKAIKDGPSLM